MGQENKKYKAPGKSDRKGISVMELAEMFPDEEAAVKWFESQIWQDGERCCGHCGCMNTSETKNRKPMPYFCNDCRSYFSCRTGTVMEKSRLPVKKWVWGIYLCTTNLKGVSSMKLHRDLDISQKAAWFMWHRIREAWRQDGVCEFKGPIEADETFIGGKEGLKHKSKKLNAGRGTVGKTPVVGARDRETKQIKTQVVESVNKETLRNFLARVSSPDEQTYLYTDEATVYDSIPDFEHEAVKHSVGEYVRGQAHTQGIESFWSMLKRGYYGTYHKMSKRHLHRYVNEFTGRHNIRDLDTIDQMAVIVSGMIGKRLRYKELIA